MQDVINLSVSFEKRGGEFKTRKQLNLNILTVLIDLILKCFHIIFILNNRQWH